MRSWRPILTGSRGLEALGIARRIGVALGSGSRRPVDPAGASPWVADGKAGLAVFSSYLGRTSTATASGDAGSRLLRETLEVASAAPLPLPLFSGLAGVAWALTHVAERRDEEDAGGLATRADREVEAHLRRVPWEGDYDLVGGLVGYGVYALERWPRPAAVAGLGLVVDRLAETAEWKDGGATWWTSPNLLPEDRRGEFPAGLYNLGVAHGVPGVIAFLGRACAAGLVNDRARDLLHGAVTWVLGQRRSGPGSAFPRWIVPGAGPGDSRQAWCYGDPGVAAALLLASRSVGEPEWEREALRIALHAASRPPETSGVVDAALCHGAAGLGHVYNRLFQASGEEPLREAAVYWLERALALRAGDAVTPDSADLDADETGAGAEADPYLLTGDAGIALALLAAATPVEPEWDRLLLLSGRETR